MITTDRLILTPLHASDAERVRELASDEALARTALSIPHPFDEGTAEDWISSLGPESHFFAIRREPEEPLIGITGLIVDPPASVAELSHGVGIPFWGNGYATEAARAMLAYGFEELNVLRIFATVLGRNAASARVLEKIGMQREGRLRGHVLHFGARHDLLYFGAIHAGKSARADEHGTRTA